uniref:Uncharacterized protein n=1 Tax=Romanomermis culicivorax TaxID=13658 RepID=A0A915KQ36_ROMCU
MTSKVDKTTKWYAALHGCGLVAWGQIFMGLSRFPRLYSGSKMAKCFKNMKSQNRWDHLVNNSVVKMRNGQAYALMPIPEP